MFRDPAHPLRKPLHWLLPIIAATLVLSGMAAAYLGGVVHATTNLHDFPIAVVNQDAGTALPAGGRLEAGRDLADGIRSGLDDDAFDLRELDLAAAKKEMREGTLYAAIVIPPTLSSDLMAWGRGAVAPGTVQRPGVVVLTNPRMGSFAQSVAARTGQLALEAANVPIGEELTTQVEQLAPAALPGTVTAALSTPIAVTVEHYRELPDGTGAGLAAFYFAMLLVLGGFTGTLTANSFIDARLGFTPDELGPRYRFHPHSRLSRRTVLLFKWAVMGVIAALVASTYSAVAIAIGMPVDHLGSLWLFSFAVLWAVAISVQAILALAGSAGMPISLFVFIFLALPSAGATIPLEATPAFFRALAPFEPIHHAYLGVRSILYLENSASSGLADAWAATGIAATLAIVIGLLGTTVYDRRGLHRAHAGSPLRRDS